MSAPPRVRPGPAALAVLVLTALALLAAVAVELTREPPPAPAVAVPVAVPAPGTGSWYCPVTAEEDDTAVLSVAAVGDDPATVTVDRHDEDGVRSEAPVVVGPGGSHELVLDQGEARWPSTVRWSGGPVVATWRVDGPDVAGARCEPAPTPQTLITGFDTTAGSVSTLHLLNPFDSDAVVRVTFGTGTGPVELVLTDNVLVPAEQGAELALNDFEPQQADLAVSVEVLAGRVVAQGAVALAPTEDQPGPTGRDVLPGTAVAGLEWSFPYARDDGDGSSSWLSLYNPGEREAAVQVQVSAPAPDSSALLGEVSVPAGGVTRVDLAGASTAVEFGVAVEGLNEVPVVATRLTAVETGSGAEGLAASPGEQPADRWALVGGGAGDRQSRVALHNPGPDPARVELDAGPGTPQEWEDIALEPNQHAILELAEVGARDAIPVLVRADGPIAADLRVQTVGQEDGLRFWTAGGVPSAVWEGPGTRPPVRRERSLATQPVADDLDDDLDGS